MYKYDFCRNLLTHFFFLIYLSKFFLKHSVPRICNKRPIVGRLSIGKHNSTSAILSIVLLSDKIVKISLVAFIRRGLVTKSEDWITLNIFLDISCDLSP